MTNASRCRRWLSVLVIGHWSLVISAGCSRPDDRPVVVGSKKFTESVILGEMGARLARTAGSPARHDNIGGSPALWLALTQGDIDFYPEYTGTIAKELLKGDPPDLTAALAEHGLRMSRPLGFRNNYALDAQDVAAAKGIRTISDLARYPDLRFGFSRVHRPADGWKGLKPHYGLPHPTPRGFDHTLAYRGLVEGSIDVMEL